ncbi:MAG: hypothetical protein SangKO_000680 [Sandaracinaceae bacterium]
MRVSPALALVALLAASAAQAQDELGVTASVERPMPATGGDDPTASATEVDAQDRPSALDTLEDGLLEVPGARPLRSGAWGSPTTLSVRGSDADQVEVLLGDVPLTTADGGAFDLSTVPLWALDRVEVYRGGAPTWLGVSGIGGVIRLVPRDGGPSAFGTVGLGSFGLGHARVGASASNGDVSWTTAVGATTSEGDFPYLADVRLLDDGEPLERPRENAWIRQGSALGHLRLRVGDGQLSAVFLGVERLGGVPGPAVQITEETRRNETNLLGALSYSVTQGGRPATEADWRVAAAASVGYRRRRIVDLRGEIGLPSETDDDGLRAVTRLAASGRATEWLELTGLALYTHESLWPEDALARRPPEDSARDGGTVAAEARLHGRTGDVRYELRPSARFAVFGARLRELRTDRAGEPNDVVQLAPSFRIGGAIEPVRGLAISASAASATRAPTALELFGDRAFLLGDTRLRPERAETFDLGAALRGRAGPVRGQAELRGFVTLASDLIRYFRNDEFRAVPQNVEGAVLAGGELGVSGSVTRHFHVHGALTLLETWTEYLGRTRRLPLRPGVTAYLRPAARLFALGPLDRVELWVDVLHVGASFWDPVNSSALPSRTRFGLGLSASTWDGRLRIDGAVRDLFDQRGTDLLGFPLPGRSFLVSLTVQDD